MTAYYNEFDPKAAAWLRELIKQGHIAPGDVDERSIEDVRPDDLRGYAQCHFFAGIGVWSYALRRARWADDRPVWTGSCPCQPFSAAGKGGGFDDERHLWPAFHYLIRECGPGVVFGEQVASKDGLGWLDLVQADLEGSGYASGAVDLCAAGVGAPHIRQRLWWVGERLDNAAGARRFGALGDAEGLARDEARLRLLGAGREADGLEHPAGDGRQQRRAEPSGRGLASGCGPVGLADADDTRPQGRLGVPERAGERAAGAGGLGGGLADAGRSCGVGRADASGLVEIDAGQRRESASDDQSRSGARGLANAERSERGTLGLRGLREVRGAESGGAAAELAGSGGHSGPERASPIDGFWRDADWLLCRDGKWRPVEPRPQQMVDGSSESLGRVLPGHVQDIELEVAEWSIRHKTDAGEALHDLRLSLSARAKREWPVGGLPDIHGAPILLAFLRQLTEQGWAFAERVSSASEEARQSRLRVLWGGDAAARSPCGRELDEQRAGEPTDAMRVLSSILARHAQEAWGRAYETYAATGFPLAVGARNRVARLRGYGNAIVAPAAQAFIEAYEESRADRYFRLNTTSALPQDMDIFS